MVSQKKLSLKVCIKCTNKLTSENWNKYDEKVSHYICRDCRKIQDKARYQSDPEYNSKQLKRYYVSKSTIIHFYGDACNQCGEDEYRKLTIDHRNGGGNAHRKILTQSIYAWLFNNPVQRDGYQILCYNCNCSKNVTYKDKYALRDKKKAIEAYGNHCADCKESRIERLTIDHQNNDGAKQRRELKCSTGVKMYRWLIKKNFPTDLGLQILCYNCNCSKRSNEKEGYCLTGFKEKKASVFDGSISASEPESREPRLL